MVLDRILTVLGKTFIAAGILVFLFVAYQLWGTGLAEARSQDKLKAEAEKAFATTTTTTAKPGTPTTTSPAPPPTPTGSFVAAIKIPKINLQKYVVEGTGVTDLKKGPGHYVNTPLPGQPGNAAIAGHRTTYGAPFGDIGELHPGDEIDVTTHQGSFRYKVSQTKVVDPSDVSVLNKTNDNRLTLTTCHPKYSAKQRLVVVAELDTTPAPASPPTTTPPTSTGNGSPNPPTTEDALGGADLSGTATSKGPALVWGLITALTALGIWGLGRATNRWVAYVLGSPVFLVVLFVFFENINRLLPANA
jgi:sortase A